MKKLPEDTILEFRAELLKERIYATFALIAVLLATDTAHAMPLQVIIILAGTSLSLWAANVVAARMSYRIVMRDVDLEPRRMKVQIALRRPLLYAAIFPIFITTLALINAIPLSLAVNGALLSLILLLVGWSLLSAKALKSGKFATILLAGIELLVGLLVVGLKLVLAH